MLSRFTLVLSVVVVLTAGTACGDDDDGPTTTTAATSTTAGTSSTSSSTNGDATVTTIEVEVRGGEVVGGVQRIEVDLGDEVVLRVTSDAAEEVHVHTYDVKANVGPGTPAEIRFTANVPGVIEVELEHSGTQLLELEIS